MFAKMSKIILALLLSVFAFPAFSQESGSAVSGTPYMSVAAAPPPGSFGIKVSGNHFVSIKDGSTVQLLGVSISGLEQGATALNTSGGGYSAATDAGFSTMARWNMNVVRIPLNEETWLGLDSGGCITGGGSASILRDNLKRIVANANANGLYVILDLHWTAPNAFGCPVGQGSMPDTDNTADFWTSVANTFKSNPAVIFEMFNEPFGTNNYNNWVEPIGGAAPLGQSAPDLKILLSGGTYSSGFQYQCNGGGVPCPSGETSGNNYTDSSFTFSAQGFQQILNAIRATGATNVVLANCIGWAGEIQTWLGAQPTDTLNPSQLGAGWHEDGGGSSTTTAANSILMAGYPIIITEAYNNGNDAVAHVLDPAGHNYFKWATRNYVGVVFWAWVDWSGGPLSSYYVANAQGSSLKSSYCAQPKVNSLASCP